MVSRNTHGAWATTNRILDVDVFPLVLQCLKARKKPVEVLVGDGVVLGVGDVGRRLDDLGSLYVFRLLAIWDDGPAVGGGVDEAANCERDWDFGHGAQDGSSSNAAW